MKTVHFLKVTIDVPADNDFQDLTGKESISFNHNTLRGALLDGLRRVSRDMEYQQGWRDAATILSKGEIVIQSGQIDIPEV